MVNKWAMFVNNHLLNCLGVHIHLWVFGDECFSYPNKHSLKCGTKWNLLHCKN